VRVTFDVTLPPDTPTDDRIYVATNIRGWAPDATPLIRDCALRAHGTLDMPSGAQLEFKLTRGDWSRGEMSAECSPIPNRTAQPTRSSTIRLTVGNWADLCVAFYDKRAQKVRLKSAALGVEKEFYVYTPPGYARSAPERYPVLYLLRGHESEWINKHQDPSRAGRNVIDVYEELLAAGKVAPMLLVFPGLTSDDGAVPGMATNFIAPELAAASGVGTGRFRDYLLEVIACVDASYRTIAAKAGRGVDGFSLGGFMSVKIAAQHPELFRTVGSFDGTHFYADENGTQVDVARDAVTFHNPMFDPAFGNPRDAAFAALNNGPNLVRNSDSETMGSLEWFVQYGPEAAEPNDSNFFRGEHLVEQLASKGVSNRLAGVFEGGHNWATADEHMRQTLPLHSINLNAGVNSLLMTRLQTEERTPDPRRQ
jgi:enterochelin esterase-like enzyme